MTTYPADAIEAALKALLEDDDWQQYGWATADMARALAAFDAAMLAHGWKRVPAVATETMLAAAWAPALGEDAAGVWSAMYDAAPEVKP